MCCALFKLLKAGMDEQETRNRLASRFRFLSGGSINRTERNRELCRLLGSGFLSVPDLGSINRAEENRGTENFVGSGSRFSVLGSCISQAGSGRHCATRGSESRA